MRRSLALTLGEPAGIGPELTLLAWKRRDAFGLPPFYVVADTDFLAGLAHRLQLAVPIAAVNPAEAASAFVEAGANFVGIVDVMPLLLDPTEGEAAFARGIEVCGLLKQRYPSAAAVPAGVGSV